MIKRIGDSLELTRYLALIGVLASALLAGLLFCVSLIRAVILIGSVPSAILSDKGAKALAVTSVELADMTLLAAALFLVAVGLFEIFIADIPLPAQLTITSLDDLKSKLINVVAVILGVTFLGQVVTWDGIRNLLSYGLSIALVIVALGVFSALRFSASGHNAAEHAPTPEHAPPVQPVAPHHPRETLPTDPTDDFAAQTRPLQRVLPNAHTV